MTERQEILPSYVSLMTHARDTTTFRVHHEGLGALEIHARRTTRRTEIEIVASDPLMLAELHVARHQLVQEARAVGAASMTVSIASGTSTDSGAREHPRETMQATAAPGSETDKAPPIRRVARIVL